jgi:hypothetical protein
VKTPTLKLRVENFCLSFVVVGTDCTGDFSWEKAIEKTILRVVGSSEFSHNLDVSATLAGTQQPVPKLKPGRRSC